MHLRTRPRVGLPHQEVGKSLGKTLLTQGEVLRSALPEWECSCPKPSGCAERHLLTHQSQGQMSVSGLRTRVPGSVRVWSAVADTPQSTQTVSCGSRQRLKQRPRTRVVFFLPAG